jgi:hypothetical protein
LRDAAGKIVKIGGGRKGGEGKLLVELMDGEANLVEEMKNGKGEDIYREP